MKILTKRQIVLLHSELVKIFGGCAGLRDEGLLDSAIAAAFHTFDGRPLLPTVQQRAVRLGYGLIMNHPFIDGNKRIGTYVMLTFLAIN